MWEGFKLMGVPAFGCVCICTKAYSRDTQKHAETHTHTYKCVSVYVHVFVWTHTCTCTLENIRVHKGQKGIDYFVIIIKDQRHFFVNKYTLSDVRRKSK